MDYLLIAYPNISKSDYDWIQGIREKADRQFSIVEPHITLVFATDRLSLDKFTDHIWKKVRTFESFNIIFDSVRIIEDDSKNFWHAFLIPSAGFNEINQLHDLLYQDELESELRHDIPFMPHLTVGSGSREEMTALVDKINQSKISIIGKVNNVNIVGFDGSKLIDINQQNLANYN